MSFDKDPVKLILCMTLYLKNCKFVHFVHLEVFWNERDLFLLLENVMSL